MAHLLQASIRLPVSTSSSTKRRNVSMRCCIPTTRTEEVRREVRNFGDCRNPRDQDAAARGKGQRSYNEMVSIDGPAGLPDLPTANAIVYGEAHPAGVQLRRIARGAAAV
jgi:hypothetical protein